MSNNALLEAALALARLGVPVFPCIAGTKHPATQHGFHDATTDEAVIAAWYARDPNLNVAYCPHERGECVIDIDGPEGEDEWFALDIEHGGTPPTKVVKTPRGGRHVYYQGELRATQHTLGKHIDTRGVGSYVLVPPSVVDGKPYTYVSQGVCAPVPEWIGAKLAEAAKAQVATAVETLDLPANVDRARSLLRNYVASGEVAVEGQGGDHRTYTVACELLNLGLSEGTALELLDTEWNEHCVPPWDYDELAIKVSNAASYAQNEAGAWGTDASSDVFGPTLDRLGVTGKDRSLRFKAYTLQEMRDRPPPEWLLKDVIAKRKIGMVYAPPGCGKTWVVAKLCADIADAGYSVGWMAGEGEDDVGPRIGAYETMMNRDLPVRVFTDVPWASDGPMMQQFVDDVKAQSLAFDLLVIDTAITMMVGLDENNAKDATQFIEAVKFLRKQLGCAVIFIHHTGKDTTRGARGSGALTGGVDSSFEVELHEPSMTFAFHVRRQRSSAKRKQPWYYESKPLAGSLILQEIDGKAYRQLTAPKSGIAAGRVHAALSKFDDEVTTRVLASTIVPEQQGESIEDREAALVETERHLKKAARGDLSDYASGPSRDLRWKIPD